jgi:hypothetical protein
MWIRSSPFVAAAIALCGCSPAVNCGDAEKATNVFRRLMDGGAYAAIYETANKGFQTSEAREHLNCFLHAI